MKSSKRRKKLRSYGAYGLSSSAKKVIEKKLGKVLPQSERRLFALAFGDIVTKKKPRFYESWDKTTREDYFEISVTGISILKEYATIHISWSFKDTKRYCCVFPNCYLGKWPKMSLSGPSKEWWQELRKALKERGFDKELPQMRVTLSVSMPELEIEDHENSFTYVGAHQRSYEWYEII